MEKNLPALSKVTVKYNQMERDTMLVSVLIINIYLPNQQMVVKTSSAITMLYVKAMAREVLSVSVRPVVDK